MMVGHKGEMWKKKKDKNQSCVEQKTKEMNERKVYDKIHYSLNAFKVMRLLLSDAAGTTAAMAWFQFDLCFLKDTKSAV